MKKLSLLIVLVMFAQFTKAQQRTITTAVPFLLVAADARSAGLADQGVATSTDAFSQQWNPAKYAFAVEQQGLSLSYTPYLTALANDISLSQITYYNKINERSAFAGSFRYFGFGDIELRQTGDQNEQFVTVSPNDFSIDGSYSLKLSEEFSMAVAGRYIHSNLKIASIDTDSSPANSFAVDIAGFYQSEEIAYQEFNGRWRAGFNFQNMGQKISYDNNDLNSDFLPATMRLGGGFDFIFDEYNKFAVSTEISKLMVPTPQVNYNTSTGQFEGKDMNGDGVVNIDDSVLAREDYNSIGWVSGIFQSFGDAPGGFSEELKELMYSVGAEYMYQDSFAFRLGYYYQNPDKGASQFFSLGAGFKYSAVKVDVSYLFSASNIPNPLENTLRFSLTFSFGEKYEVY